MAASYRLEYRPQYFIEQGYTGNRFTLVCTQVENHLNNTSTIYWSFDSEFHEGNPESITTGPTTVTIAGQQVYSCKRQDASSGKFPSTAIGSGVSGSIIVEHNADGTKSIPVSIASAVYYTTIETVSGEWNLDSIDKVSKVAQNPAEIGDTAVCVITADSQLYRHTVAYEFGTLTGTVVSDVPGGSYTWTFPEAFYTQIPDTDLSKTGTLTCTTYLNEVATGTSTCTFTATVSRGMPPLLTVTVEDADATTVALTGNSHKMIPGFSDITYVITATARNGASVASYSATNGSSTLSTATGTFGNSKASSFSFYATDTRGLTGSCAVVMPTIANYYGPTVKITDIDFGTDGKLVFNLSGMWWDNNFGAQNNSVALSYRYKVVNGSWGGWTNSGVADNNTGRYANGAQITGLNYKSRYVLQARIVDKLQTVMTPEIIVNANPVFDWSETDFNFNVPVNFSAGVSGIRAEDIDGAGLRYGTCNVSSSTIEKSVTSPGFSLFVGASIRVKFDSGNSVAAPTLNVNNTGAKAIRGSTYVTTVPKWYSGEVRDFVYDGTYWIMVDGGIATTSNHGLTILTDTVNGDTDKAVTPYGVQQKFNTLNSAISSLSNAVNKKATTSQYGSTILTSTVDGTTENKAVTPKGVKDAIDTALAGGGGQTSYGTWTPSLYTGGVGSSYFSYTQQSGWWQKVGNVYTIGFYIACNVGSYSTSSSAPRRVYFYIEGTLPGLSSTSSVTSGGGGFLSKMIDINDNDKTSLFQGWKIMGNSIMPEDGLGTRYYIPRSSAVICSGTISYAV